MSRKSVAVAGFMLLAIASAKADCTTSSNPFDDVYCDIQVFHQADHQLNVDYGALAKLLKPAEVASLKHGEIDWIKDRNATCTSTQGSYEFVAMDCAVALTNKRDEFIKARERECGSTGCVDDALGREYE